MKKFLFDKRGITKMQAIILAAVIIVAAVAAGVAAYYYMGTEGTTKKTIVAVIIPSSELEDCIDYLAGAKQALAELGGDQFELRWAASSYDVAVDLTNLNSLIAAGAELAIGYGGGTAWLRPALEAIYDNQVYFAESWHLLPDYAPWDSEWDPYWVSFSAASGRVGMYEIAYLLFSHLDGQGNIAYIPGPTGVVPAEERTTGIEKAAAEFPNIQLFTGAPALKWAQEEGYKNMEDLLTTHPDIDGIIGCNDGVALGMRDAAMAHGLGLLPAVGWDGIRSALEEIQAGRMYATISHTAAFLGGYAMVRAFDAWKGASLTHDERATWLKTTIVCDDNVDSIFPEHTSAWLSSTALYDDIYGAQYKLRGGFIWNFTRMSKYYAQQEGFAMDPTAGGATYGGIAGPIDMDEFSDWMVSVGIS